MRIPQPAFSLSSLFNWAKQILAKEVLHGFVISDVLANKVGTGAVVSHKLGRMPVGAIIIKGDSFVALRDFTETTIAVYGSSTVSIWIF